jgi:eukaryotic-like serine/threonine-protein kinase
VLERSDVQARSTIDEDTTLAAKRVGTTLRGKWRLDALIDVGGMAAIYSATRPDGLRGAVKVPKPHTSLAPEVACKFLRESHPNAVRVLDDDVDDDGNVCVVMELLEGETLHELARAAGGKLAPDDVLRVLDQLLGGVAALHDAGIVHRDIKPANVFLTNDGRVKLLDFGIARIGEAATDWAAAANGVLVMGTPDYMSPEQARGRWDLVDALSDLWSVGALAFTLLSGEIVHQETTLPELLVAAFENEARSLSTALPSAPGALVALVDRALARKRAERFPDAFAMRAAVRAVFRALYGHPLSVAPLGGRRLVSR